MYAALWRVLPGPWFLKLVILLAAVAAILTACVLWIFPWVDILLAPQDVVVTE